VFATCSCFCATPASAIIIDKFASGSGFGVDNANPVFDIPSYGAPAAILGIERDVRLQRSTAHNTGDLPGDITFVSTPSAYSKISPGNSNDLDVTFQWDGSADSGSNVLDATGLSSTVNLLGGGSNLISVNVSNGASPTQASFVIRDSANVITTNNLVIPPGYTGDLQFYFYDFDTSANFSQVEAMQLQLSVGYGTTFYLRGVLQSEYIFLGLPEPSTASLLLPVLCGTIWRRRRKKLAKVC
jgi:hypothetical protein